MKKICFILLILSFQAAFAAPLGRIVDTHTGQTLSPEQLAHELSQAQIVLIGEQHDQIQHHQAQVWLLQQTEKSRENGSVALEMLSPEQQNPVREMQNYLLGGGKTGKRSLESKINWNAAWDWAQYQNLMHTLLNQKAQVLSGSPARTDLAQHADFTPKGSHSNNPTVRENLAKLMNLHHGNPQNMVSMQQYKDWTMSQVLLKSPQPAWLIAGNVHVSKQLGVPLFLRDSGFSGSLKVVLLSQQQNNQEIDHQHADYIWYF